MSAKAAHGAGVRIVSCGKTFADGTRALEPATLDESLRNLVELSDAGMLDCWILINGADEGIQQDYDAYRKGHRQLLRDYLDRFVARGGVN